VALEPFKTTTNSVDLFHFIPYMRDAFVESQSQGFRISIVDFIIFLGFELLGFYCPSSKCLTLIDYRIKIFLAGIKNAETPDSGFSLARVKPFLVL
jgi:hypothetical protein